MSEYKAGRSYQIPHICLVLCHNCNMTSREVHWFTWFASYQDGWKLVARTWRIYFNPLAFKAEGVLSLPVCLYVYKLVCTKTLPKFEIESPNFHQTCRLACFQLIYISVNDLDFKLILAILLWILGNLACPPNNSSQLLGWNCQICTKYASCNTLRSYVNAVH